MTDACLDHYYTDKSHPHQLCGCFDVLPAYSIGFSYLFLPPGTLSCILKDKRKGILSRVSLRRLSRRKERCLSFALPGSGLCKASATTMSGKFTNLGCPTCECLLNMIFSESTRARISTSSCHVFCFSLFLLSLSFQHLLSLHSYHHGRDQIQDQNKTNCTCPYVFRHW